jgi:6-phosphofructo-2-kinase
MVAAGAATSTRPRRTSSATSSSNSPRRYSQHSVFAKNVLMSRITVPTPETAHPTSNGEHLRPASALPSLSSAAPTTSPRSLPPTQDSAPQQHHGELKPRPYVGLHSHQHGPTIAKDGVGAALTDTPAPSVPTSPRM